MDEFPPAKAQRSVPWTSSTALAVAMGVASRTAAAAPETDPGSRSLVAASSVAMGLLAVADRVVFYVLFADDSPRPSASRLAPLSSVGPTGFNVGLARRF